MLLKQKRGVSVIIGYVLLVVFAMVISVGVYAWLKTYVPNEPLNCPDGVSLFAKEASFNSSTSVLNIKIRNNGRFDAAGYFIHAANTSAQQLPSIDLSSYLNEDDQGIKFGNSVLFSVTGDNSLSPGEEKTNTFNVPAAIGNIYSVRVIPTRFQEENNRQRFVSCGDARVQQIVGAPATGGGSVCGNSACESGENSVSCPQDCPVGGGPLCGNNVVDTGEQCDDGNTVNTDACTNTCQNATCGDGIIQSGVEQCDQGSGNIANGDGCSSTCQIESGYVCSGTPSTCTFQQVQIAYFGFESNTPPNQGWVDPSGADSDRSNSNPPGSKVLDNGASGGTWSWRIRDNNANSYTEQSFDFSGANQIKLEWWGYYSGFENTQSDCLVLKVDNTNVSGWGTLNCMNNPNIVTQLSWITQSVIISSSQYTFDSSVAIKFQGYMNNENDHFYFDGFNVTRIS